MRNKSLSITLKSSRTPLFHTSLSKKQRTEWFVCLSHTGGYIFMTSFVRDAIANKPCDKLLINLKCPVFTRNSQTLLSLGQYGKVLV